MTLGFPARLDGPEIWIVDLESAANALEEVEAVTPRLGPDDEERIAAICDATARRERRSAYIALRLLVERAFGRELRRARLARSPAGKPSLPGAKGGFSLSHIAGLALVGLAPQGTIGVDVERSRPVRISDERRRRIEAAAGALAPDWPLPQDPGDRFTQAWVRLEAAAKADGSGVGPLLERFGVRRARDGIETSESAAARASGAGSGPGLPALEVHDLPMSAGLLAAAAMTPGQRSPKLLNLPVDRAGLDGVIEQGSDLQR